MAWKTLGWASAAPCAFVSGLFAYFKVRSLSEHHASSLPLRVLYFAGVLLVNTRLFVLVPGIVEAHAHIAESAFWSFP